MKGGGDNAKGERERSDEIEIKIYAREERESEQSAHCPNQTRMVGTSLGPPGGERRCSVGRDSGGLDAVDIARAVAQHFLPSLKGRQWERGRQAGTKERRSGRKGGEKIKYGVRGYGGS